MIVIVSFADPGTEDLFNGRDSAAARRCCPGAIRSVAWRKLDQLNATVSLDGLRIPPGNRLEVLQADRKGQYSIRINDQFRVCFRWTENGPADVQIVDYH